MHGSVRVLILCWALPAALSAEMRFSDQALAAGVADDGEANGAAFGDFSGDGLPDLFVARLGRSARPLLYRNEGDLCHRRSGWRAVRLDHGRGLRRLRLRWRS